MDGSKMNFNNRYCYKFGLFLCRRWPGQFVIGWLNYKKELANRIKSNLTVPLPKQVSKPHNFNQRSMMDQAKSQIISNHDHNLLTFITVFSPTTILRATGRRVETAAAAHQITFRSPSPQPPSLQSVWISSEAKMGSFATSLFGLFLKILLPLVSLRVFRYLNLLWVY